MISTIGTLFERGAKLVALIGSIEFLEEKKIQVASIGVALEKVGIKDPKQVEYHSACAFLLGLFGDAWYRKHIKMHSKPDPWMLNGDDDWLKKFPSDFVERRIAHYSRTIRLADALFTILSRPNSDEEYIKGRFKNSRDIKAPFLEIQIASLLVVHGYQVEVKKEISERGSDFDLEITKVGEKVSVEVTGKDDGSLTVKTLINTLKAKRNQVPNHQPAVLYIHVPAIWMSSPETMDVFRNAFEASTTNLKRYNVIVLVCEEVIADNEGGSPIVSLHAAINLKARHLANDPTCFGTIPLHYGRKRLAYSYFDSVFINNRL